MTPARPVVPAAGKLPDFLGIGVVRGGSTWLWENLRQHPEIWLSPVKETTGPIVFSPCSVMVNAMKAQHGKQPYLLLIIS